jgi:ubiquinone/menaquinone biosynthesis C-methylase UbiE
MSDFIKEEFGSLAGSEKNRYWEIKLSKYDFLSNEHNWIGKLFWRLLTLLMFFPLCLTAKYYSFKYNRNKNQSGDTDIFPYQLFTEIYPACVYSPFIKAYELELFKKCDMRGPTLEIGVGDGYFSSLLSEAKQQKLTFGADLMYGTLKSARQYQHCENYIIMDALEIPLPDNSLGTVIMNNLMHHLPNRMLALEEILRVLKKGGRFIFTENTLGWGIYTWEQLFLRKIHLNSLANIILKYKLTLFAQTLLVDDNLYNKKAKDMDFSIINKINFTSKTAMYLSSLFEFLNLKQGQPTRPEMRKWLAFFGCQDLMQRRVADILEYCHQRDRKECEDGRFAYQFWEIEKKGGIENNSGNHDVIPFVCPQCKGSLDKHKSSFSCNRCNLTYPIFDDIPIFLSYQNKLDGLKSYLRKKEKDPITNYIT